MIMLILAVIALCAFLLSVYIHIMSFLGFDYLVVAIFLLVGAMVFIFPGTFFFSVAVPPYNRSFQANHNFWRLIPERWVNILKLTALYGFGGGLITAFLFNQHDFLPPPYSTRVVSGFAANLFLYHFLAYWYHAPINNRESLTSLLFSKKYSKRHRKTD